MRNLSPQFERAIRSAGMAAKGLPTIGTVGLREALRALLGSGHRLENHDNAPAVAEAPERYLSVREVADLLGVSERTVTRRIADGVFASSTSHKNGRKGRPGFVVSSGEVLALKKNRPSRIARPLNPRREPTQKGRERASSQAPEGHLTILQIARVLGLTPTRMRQLIAMGEFPSARKHNCGAHGRPPWIVTQADYEDFISRRAARVEGIK